MDGMRLFLQILTALPNLILTAEGAFSGKPGSGEFKKKLVMDSVTTALDVSSSLDAKISDEQKQVITAASSSMVENVVQTIKAFDKKPTEQPAPTT